MRWTGKLSGGEVDDDFGSKMFLVVYGLFAFLVLAGFVLGGVGLYAYSTGNEVLAKAIASGLFLGATFSPAFFAPGLGYVVWQDFGRVDDEDTGWTFAFLTTLAGSLLVVGGVLFLLFMSAGRGTNSAGIADPTPILGISYGTTVGLSVLFTFLAAGVVGLVRLREESDDPGEATSRNRRVIDRYR
jgi:hypothetical protein